MAWNEPGGNPGKRNPWGSNKPDQGPPDLDEVIRNLQRRLSGLFGGGTGGRSTGSGVPGRGFGLGTILLALATIWAFTGLYRVDAAERGIILRFGRHVDTTMPGLHWHMPWPIETKQIVNTAAIDSFTEQTRMLTSDENLVEINLEVQYRASNALDFAFNVYKPEDTLKEVSESAIREVIGRSKLDSVLESGRRVLTGGAAAVIYRRDFGAFLDRWETRCTSSGIDYTRVTTDQPLDAALRGYLLRRSGGRG